MQTIKHDIYTETSTNVGIKQQINCYKRFQCITITGNSHVNVSSVGSYSLNITLGDNYKPSMLVYGVACMVSGVSHTEARVYISQAGGIAYYIPATGEYEFYWIITYMI